MTRTMSAAVPLIYFESDKLKTNPKGLQALKDIPDEYGIVNVSMVGDGRIGKSSLLNQIAGKNVFEVGSTTTRVTEGILIYVRLDSTCKRAYIYCDVEGFGDPSKKNCDERLLVIISQICDMIVFNIKGVYDSELRQKLMLSSVLFNKYRKKNIVLSNPGLVVVIRDFDLDLPESPDDELGKLLQTGNKVIPKSFRSVKAFQLVRPAERKQLRNLKDLPDSELDTDFVLERSRLQEYLKSEAKPLCSQTDNLIGGKVLAQLIQKIIEAVNNDKLDNITQTLPDLLQQNNQRLKKVALRSYEQRLTSIWPSTSAPETLQTHLQTVTATTKDDLRDKLVDFDGSVFELLKDFEAKTWTISDRICKEKCEKELARVSSSFENDLKQNTYSEIGGHKKYLSDKKGVETEYKNLKNLGQQAESVWRTYETELQPKEKMIQDGENILLRLHTAETQKEQALKETEASNKAREEAERHAREKEDNSNPIIDALGLIGSAVGTGMAMYMSRNKNRNGQRR